MSGKDFTYVIEHLDQELYPWCRCEYYNICELTFPSKVIFTNSTFPLPDDWKAFNTQVTNKNIEDLGIEFSQICLLDSEAPEILTPADKEKFSVFIFGGILGNTDEFDFDRTKIIRERGFARRNIGKMQMTTDTAVRCTKMIVEDEIPFEKIPFIDRPEIHIAASESLIMNFRFVRGPDGQPLMAPGIIDILMRDHDFDYDKLE